MVEAEVVPPPWAWLVPGFSAFPLAEIPDVPDSFRELAAAEIERDEMEAAPEVVDQ